MCVPSFLLCNLFSRLLIHFLLYHLTLSTLVRNETRDDLGAFATSPGAPQIFQIDPSGTYFGWKVKFRARLAIRRFAVLLAVWLVGGL